MGLAGGLATNGGIFPSVGELPASVVIDTWLPANVLDPKYGAVGNGTTLDTVAVQAAINAASVVGTLSGAMVGVVLPSGYNFKLGQIVPKNNVAVWAYGATITQKSGEPTFFVTAGASVSNFGLLGATIVGTNSVSDKQVVYVQGSCSDIHIRDNNVSNLAAAPFVLSDCQRVWVEDNEMRSVGVALGQNPIDIVGSAAANPLNDVFIRGNYIDACPTECIGVVAAASATTSQVMSRIIITDNNLEALGGTGSWCLAVELDIPHPEAEHEIIIANNHVRLEGGAGGQAIIVATAGAGPGSDPTLLQNITITGNEITSTQSGIRCDASWASVNDNDVTITTAASTAVIRAGSRTVAATGDISNGSPTVLNANTSGVTVENGDPVTATGVPQGAYILSGAGTSTWTLNTNATATQVGQALTVYRALSQLQITDNRVSVPNGFNGQLVYLQGVVHSDVEGNRLVSATGAVSAIATGIRADQCGWVNVKNNKIEHVSQHGILFVGGNDVWVQGNRIYNPSEGASGNKGIWLEGILGTSNVDGNRVVDDRATPLMSHGIYSDGTNGVLNASGNTISGALTANYGGAFSATSRLSVEHALWRPSGAIAETYPRIANQNIGNIGGALTSGTLYLAGGLVVPAAQSVASGTLWTGTTPLTIGSNADGNLWFVLLRATDKVAVAVSAAGGGAVTWGASSAKTMNWATSLTDSLWSNYTPMIDTPLMLGVLIVVGTGGAPAMPTLTGVAMGSTARTIQPFMSATGGAALTGPPTVGDVLTLTASSVYGYGYVN